METVQSSNIQASAEKIHLDLEVYFEITFKFLLTANFKGKFFSEQISNELNHVCEIGHV